MTVLIWAKSVKVGDLAGVFKRPQAASSKNLLLGKSCHTAEMEGTDREIVVRETIQSE